IVAVSRFLPAPMPLVVLDWGSISTSNTRRPASARYVARLMAVVVLPTPPFWFTIPYNPCVAGSRPLRRAVRSISWSYSLSLFLFHNTGEEERWQVAFLQRRRLNH